jgi:hypothetical protein
LPDLLSEVVPDVGGKDIQSIGHSKARELAYLSTGFGTSEAASFLKRGSFRKGSNIGSSLSSAGVMGAGRKSRYYVAFVATALELKSRGFL